MPREAARSRRVFLALGSRPLRGAFRFPCGPGLCFLCVVWAGLITGVPPRADGELAFYRHWVIDPQGQGSYPTRLP